MKPPPLRNTRICTCGRTRPHCAERQRCIAALCVLALLTILACGRVRRGLNLVRPAAPARDESPFALFEDNR
jgi:hypothetical protein